MEWRLKRETLQERNTHMGQDQLHQPRGAARFQPKMPDIDGRVFDGGHRVAVAFETGSTRAEIVEIGQPVLGQQLKHRQATGTTEAVFPLEPIPINTRQTTVTTKIGQRHVWVGISGNSFVFTCFLVFQLVF